jgi:hypothetical protein
VSKAFLRAAPIALPFAFGGCVAPTGPISLHPGTPPRSVWQAPTNASGRESEDLATTRASFELDEMVSEGQALATWWSVHSDPGVQIELARLSTDERPACEDGTLPRFVGVAGSLRAGWPVSVPADQKLALEFQVPKEIREGELGLPKPGTVIDFKVSVGKATGCVRASLVARERRAGWTAQGPWFLGSAYRLYFPSGAMGFGASFAFRGGKWIGPLRLGVELGLGEANAGGLIVSGATAELSILRASLFALSLDVGPDIVLEKPTIADRPRYELFYGPRSTLHVGLANSPAPPPDVLVPQKLISLELEFPVALWWSSQRSGPAWVFGVTLASYGWL